MAGISLNGTACTRSASKQSTCQICDTLCPVDAIKIVPEALPAINLFTCIGCGACVGGCPTEALALDDFSPTEFFFTFVAETSTLISCQSNVPCISVLNVEHLIALASFKGDIILDMGHCDTCTIAPTCQKQIVHHAEEANYVLEAMSSDARVQTEKVAFTNEQVSISPDRRDFFRTFTLKNVHKTQQQFERRVEMATDEFTAHHIETLDTSAMKEKRISDRRKLLFSALKRQNKPDTYHIVDATTLSFISQKLLDETRCTACQMCYRICPSGALSSDMRDSKIDFDALLCLRCHLCHDVCESDAITLSSSFNLRELFEPSIENLVAFKMFHCHECGLTFASLQGERMCRRCRIEEDEAKELWGIT